MTDTSVILCDERDDFAAGLDLPKMRRTCPDCLGGPGRERCDRCNGTGEITRYSASTYEHAMRIAERRAEVERDIAERRQAFESRIQRLQAEMEAALKPLAARVEFYDSLLTERLMRLREQNPRMKSEPLCSGVKVQSRTAHKWHWGDEAALLARLKAIAPALVRIKEETDRAALKRAATVQGEAVVLTETGEVLPEIGVTQETTYKVVVEPC